MDPDEIDLFLEAQNGVWDAVRAELIAGKKTTHWIWFVFPQLASLGQSDMSQLFGLHDLSEARDYLADPRLRGRLEEATGLILMHHDKTPEDILGPVDAVKLRSSMTLFAQVEDAPAVFDRVLQDFFHGQPCSLTLKALETT